MAASPSISELLQRLDEQHQKYLETFKLVHEALSQTANTKPQTISSSPPANGAVSKRRRRSTLDPADADRPALRPSTYHSSVLTGETDESDDDEELFASTPLAGYSFDHEDLRHHLRTYDFTEQGRILLESVVRNKRLIDPGVFPVYPESEKWHNSHYSVFDVGTDGAPFSRHKVVKEGTTSIDSAIWQAIQDLNAPDSQQKAVGRITIVREPSPVVLGGLHLTMNQSFDMDEIFEKLLIEGDSGAFVHNRTFSSDQRHQRSFVFKFDYYTIVGEEIQPMPWQKADPADKIINKVEHIPISRCSSVVALSLSGGHVRKLRNAARRATTQHGYAYDPWAPWHVLNIQCYPDHKHSMDSHDATKHYVNGPEAFLHTLLADFKDAEKRFEDIYTKISKLVIPPADFMFNGDLRDKLLFEDEKFTYSRRYFWAFQTLGLMNNSIRAIRDAYEDTFTDEVWEGTHKSLWPVLDPESKRNQYWRTRMASLRKQFEKQMKNLEKLYEENDERRKEIRTLRDQLFSGTSVQESRKSVELSTVTILQGHNIKLLTLVSIFFLPLTFVTSVFGMTNMPTEHQFKWFGVAMATVCLPFFILIGSLNTTSGMEFWRGRWHKFLAWISEWFAGRPDRSDTFRTPPRLKKRSVSAAETQKAIQIRKNQVAAVRESRTPNEMAVPKIDSHGMPITIENGGDSHSTGNGKRVACIISASSSENGISHGRDVEAPKRWWEKLIGKKRATKREHDV